MFIHMHCLRVLQCHIWLLRIILRLNYVIPDKANVFVLCSCCEWSVQCYSTYIRTFMYLISDRFIVSHELLHVQNTTRHLKPYTLNDWVVKKKIKGYKKLLLYVGIFFLLLNSSCLLKV